MQNAKLNNFDPHTRVSIQVFEDWQMKIFKKNAKKGWRFFQPDNFDKPTPRSAREAWGAPYKPDDFEKNEKITNRIMLGLFLAVVVVLSII